MKGAIFNDVDQEIRTEKKEVKNKEVVKGDCEAVKGNSETVKGNSESIKVNHEAVKDKKARSVKIGIRKNLLAYEAAHN